MAIPPHDDRMSMPHAGIHPFTPEGVEETPQQLGIQLPADAMHDHARPAAQLLLVASSNSGTWVGVAREHLEAFVRADAIDYLVEFRLVRIDEGVVYPTPALIREARWEVSKHA